MIFDFIKKESEGIISLLMEIWDTLKKVFTAIFNFFKNLRNWFLGINAKVRKKYPSAKAIAVKIQDDIANENYNKLDIGLSENSEGAIVNTYYDEYTGEILEEYTEVVEYGVLDAETKKHFGDKAMLVLE